MKTNQLRTRWLARHLACCRQHPTARPSWRFIRGLALVPRLSSFLVVLWVFGYSAAAQPARGAAGTVTVDFNFSPDDVTLGRSMGFDSVELKDGLLPEDTPGTPWIPATFVNVLVPAGANVIGISTEIQSEGLVANNLNLLPVQPPVPLSGKPGRFVGPNAAAYASAARYPGAAALQQGVLRMRGWTLVPLRLNPLRYVARTGELYLAQAMTVTVRYVQPARPPQVHPRNRGAFRETVETLVANPGLPGAEPSSAEAQNDGPLALGDCDYLIITSADLEGAFQALADHRTAHDGLTAGVITTDMIAASYDGTRPDGGSDLQTQIRNCIANYVQNNGTLYVVLGGDSTVVPDRDCYVTVSDDEALGITVASDMPTDLYYAGLGGTWDADRDGVYGEAGETDEADLGVDVFVGRIPVQTLEQAADYINKVIAYDESPISPFDKKMFLGGAMTWDSYMGTSRPADTMNDGYWQFREHEPVSDVEIWARRFYKECVQACGWEGAPLALFLDTITAWDTDGAANAGNYQQDYVNMTARLSEGWNFAVFNTHGGYTGWALESGAFNASDALALTGPARFIYTVACETGGFDMADPCLSEAFLRCKYGGALVYMGSSRYGWGWPGSYDGGGSFTCQREFFRQVFEFGQPNISEAFFAHKTTFAANSVSNNVMRWIQFGLNLQGDPALRMHIPPGRTTQASPVDGELYVSTSPMLSWTAGGGATSHDIYFGTSDSLVFQGNQSETTFDPGVLAGSATYYWRIDEVNLVGTTTGVVWRFTTGPDNDRPVLTIPADTVITMDDPTDPAFTGQATATDIQDPDPSVTYSDSPGEAQPDPYIITRTWTATDDAGNSTSGNQVITVIRQVNQFAMAETTREGTVAGSYTYTYASDNVYEVLTEAVTGGKPSSRRSVLDHEWRIAVESGDVVTLWVEGHHTANAENDHFEFLYSVDGINYTSMFVLTDTADETLSYGLPPSTVGTVYVWVRDTDNTKGNTVADKVYVDGLMVQSQTWPVGTMPPGPAYGPSPADGATQVPINVTLSWSPGASSEGSYVYFGMDNTLLLLGYQSDTNFNLEPLDYQTTYIWRIDEVNAAGLTVGPVWSFTTQTEPGQAPTDLHVADIAVGITPAGKKVKAQARVLVLDDFLNPVAGATVTGTFTGDFTETISGLTDASGVAVIGTARSQAEPVSFTFTVDDISGTLPYDPGDNVMTWASY